ncbi:MAG: GNAT family N-acetyltransferase [Ktedonobacteraceae bacterium]
MSYNKRLETFPVLETQRLVLRELQPEDAAILFRFYSDEEVMRYYDTPMNRLEQVQRSIAAHRSRFENNEAIRWGITIKGTKDVVGNCGFYRDSYSQFAILSYVLARPYWGKGLMTEALKAIITFGFDHYYLHRIEAHVAVPNLASQRVLQKLGFKKEGFLRERFYENNHFHDEWVFALLKGDREALSLKGVQ